MQATKQKFKVAGSYVEMYIYHQIENLEQLDAFLSSRPKEPVGYVSSKGEYIMAGKGVVRRWNKENLLNKGVFVVKTEIEMTRIASRLAEIKETMNDEIAESKKEAEPSLPTHESEVVFEGLLGESFEESKITFSSFFWNMQRAGVLVCLLFLLLSMVFSTDTIKHYTAFAIGWMVFFSGIIVLYIAIIARDWSRLNS